MPSTKLPNRGLGHDPNCQSREPSQGKLLNCQTSPNCHTLGTGSKPCQYGNVIMYILNCEMPGKSCQHRMFTNFVSLLKEATKMGTCKCQAESHHSNHQIANGSTTPQQSSFCSTPHHLPNDSKNHSSARNTSSCASLCS